MRCCHSVGQVLAGLRTHGVWNQWTKLNALLAVICFRVREIMEYASQGPSASPAAALDTPPRRSAHRSQPPTLALVDAHDLRALFLSRSCWVDSHRIWTADTMVQFLSDIGLVDSHAFADESPRTHNDSGAVRHEWASRVAGMAPSPTALSESAVRTLVGANIAETRSKNAGHPQGLGFNAFVAVLGDVAPLAFIDVANPGILFRQYLHVAVALASDMVGEQDESPFRVAASAIRGHVDSTIEATLLSASSDDSGIVASAPLLPSFAHQSIGDQTSHGGLELAPRLGLPVAHEAALRHIFER